MVILKYSLLKKEKEKKINHTQQLSFFYNNKQNTYHFTCMIYNLMHYLCTLYATVKAYNKLFHKIYSFGMQ